MQDDEKIGSPTHAAEPRISQGAHRKAARERRVARPLAQGPVARWAICALFAAGITLAILQFSFQHGRLIFLPTYDDIGYFADAAWRVRALYDGGLPGLADTYWIEPPHSPYSTGMAVAAFTLFGIHDWAPYVLNSLLALGYFLLADRLLRGVGLGRKLLCFAVLACLPFVGMAVHEFRPDFAVALFTAAGVMLLLCGSLIHAKRGRLIWAGAWLGIAMLTKPPVFPQTLAIGLTALFLSTVADWYVLKKRPSFGSIARAWSAVLIPFILIPLPHYLLASAHIFHYIHSILAGTFEQSYAYHGTVAQHALYYLTGPGNTLMMGNSLRVFAAAILVGGLALAVVGTRRDRSAIVAMCLMIGLAWLIPTVNKTKSNYFGLGFDTLLAFTLLFMIGRLLTVERPRPQHLRRLATLGIWAILLLCAWNFQWPERNGNVNAGWQAQRRLIVQSTFDTIVNHCDFFHADGAPIPDPSIPPTEKVHVINPKILFCCKGDFNDDLLKFMAIQRQLRIDTIFPAESSNPADFIDDFQRADFIYCAEPGSKLIADFLPFGAFEQQLLDAASDRSEFDPVGKWTFMKSEHSLYLFKRRDWQGFEMVSGFGQLEGPYAQIEMNTVRWGLGPKSIIHVPVDRDGVYEFYWRCRSDFAKQIVSVKRDGELIGTQEVNYSHKDFGENRFPMFLKAGEHEIEFDYSTWHTETPRPLAVLFEHMNVARRKKQ